MAAVNAAGTSALSNEVSATPLSLPEAPTLTSAVAGNAQVTLKWSAISGAISYKIFRGTTAGGESTTPIKSGITGTSMVITGLTNGKKYFFKMAAVNAAGTSALSNEVSATPRVPKPDFMITALVLSPTSPKANGSFKITVTIKNQGTVAGMGRYLNIWANQPAVQTCGAEGDAWAEINSLDAGESVTVTLSLTTRNGGSRTLRAFIDSSCGTAESNEGNNQFTWTYVVTPAAPTISSAIAGNKQVTLKWSAVAGATSYKIHQGVTVGGESSTPVKAGVTGTSTVITGLTNGRQYFFKMTAVNAGGSSPLSNEISAIPLVSNP
ncbi:hypothetical protein CCP3SC5AM1_1050010 [Gammaproteobacteria bacterium]